MKKMLIYAITSPLLLIYWSLLNNFIQNAIGHPYIVEKKKQECVDVIWAFFIECIFGYFPISLSFLSLSIFFLLDCLLSLVLLLVLKNSMI